MRILKRDGSYQPFDVGKVKRAVLLSFANSVKVPDVGPIVNNVIHNLNETLGNSDITSVSTIQEVIEQTLIASGYHEQAHTFISYRVKRDQMRSVRLKADDTAIADYVTVSKYSRLKEGRREVYPEIVNRVMQMHISRYPQYEKQIRGYFEYVHRREVLPSMRAMQFAGEAILKDNARMYNCSYTLVDRPRVFAEIYYLLLCGCGVGYSVQWPHVEQLPSLGYVNEDDVVHHTVEDTIVGWAEAINALINSFIDGKWVEYNYSEVRGRGVPLVTSGGLAPGHVPLRKCLEAVRGVLLGAQGRQLRPIECHDIICYIARSVLSGGIRRSSLIALFSHYDTEMLYCKAKGNFRYAQGNDPGINSQREMANNSAVILRSMSDKSVYDRVIRIANENWGDPGFYFTNNIDYGCNPCGEIGLYPKDDDGKTGFAFCNLTEVNMGNVENLEDYVQRVEAASFIGTLQATYTDFTYLGKVTERIAARDRLLGVSMTGMMDNPDIAFNPEYQRIAAKHAVVTNKIWADRLGIRQARSVTTVKPSGTASLVLNVASGIHPHHARRWFRGVTAKPNEPHAIYFKQINPHMVHVKPNGDWFIVFCREVGAGAVTVKELTATEHMRLIFSTYENWVLNGTTRGDLHHNVSATVSIADGEDVSNQVWENRHRISAMSFAPKLLDKKVPFVPNEAVITEEDELRWNNYIRNYKKVDWLKYKEGKESRYAGDIEGACVGGACEI